MSVGRLLGAACVLVGFAGMPAAGATEGLWLFDTMEDVTPPVGDPPSDPPGGLTFYDSSGNNLNIVTGTNFGTFALTTDRPAVMPPGTFALDSWFGGAGAPATPTTNLLSRGATGEMTIEFWYKANEPEPSPFGYLMNFGASGATGRWAIYRDDTGKLNFFSTDNGFVALATGTDINNYDKWSHLAFTIDAAGVHTLYVDGASVAQTGALGAAAAALSGKLNFAGDPSFGNSNHRFFIDEMRFSDVALLPGNGTGVDELAWNATLVIPEPAVISSMLVMLAGGLVARPRLRRAALR